VTFALCVLSWYISVPRIVGHHLYDFVISVQIAGCTAPRCLLTKMRIRQLWAR